MVEEKKNSRLGVSLNPFLLINNTVLDISSIPKNGSKTLQTDQ
jgi:hypothetical protein